MPTIDEMESAIGFIRERCRSHEGSHAQYLAELALRLDPQDLDGGRPTDTRHAAIKSQYLDAVSTLLALASPPTVEMLEATLSRIGSIVGERLGDVLLVEPGLDQEAAVSLRKSLPEAASRSDRMAENIAFFRKQLHPTDWTQWRER